MSEEFIYLDHAAATPMHKQVIRSMEPYFSEFFYNPSALYAPAVQVKQDYSLAKKKIAIMENMAHFQMEREFMSNHSLFKVSV